MKKIVSLLVILGICILQCVPANATQSEDFHNIDIDILSNSTQNYKASKLDSKYDPRSSDSSLLTSVKNQEDSNLCWTYSAVAVAEINNVKNKNSDNSIDLSENQLGYTFYNRINDPLGNTSKDKNSVSDDWYDIGGDTYTLINHLSGYSGMVKEDNQNYKNYKTSNSNYYLNNNTVLKNAIYINNDDSTQIKQAILKYGSVTCGFEYGEY
jgi:C1A family cysteine protease